MWPQRRARFSLKVMLGLMTLCGVVFWLWSTEPWCDPRFTTRATLQYEEQTRRIVDELRGQPLAPWSGEYGAYHVWGDGLLALSVNHGWIYRGETLFYCQGYQERNFGTLTVQDGVLRLQRRFDDQVTPEELVFIQWGQRHYVVSPSRLADFCAAVNCGAEPRTSLEGHFLLRCGDENKTVTGRPRFPAAFARYAALLNPSPVGPNATTQAGPDLKLRW